MPSWETMDMVVKSNYKDAVTSDYITTLLNEIREKEIKDWRFVQEKSLNFCRQQELIKAKNKIDKIINNGEFENYETCVEIIQKALTVANEKKDEVTILDNIEHVISDEFRDPIKTGITGIDNITNGGLGKGELAIILAPFGIGKSTILTKIANTAYNDGKNVLQIIFEDTPKVIQRKHYTCWTGIELNELSNNKEILLDYVENNIKNKKNRLVIKKFPSYGTTIGTIKNYIRNELSSGNRFDIIILDYIDCLTPERMGDNDWSNGEAGIMRGFESMLSEFDLAGWTAIQGNRCVSLDTQVVIENKGLIEIKDVILNDKILTQDGYKNVSHIFPIEKQPVYRIKLKSGKEIKVSKKHFFPTSNNELLSIESGLSVGDKLLINKNSFFG
jgi:hypothetical protein